MKTFKFNEDKMFADVADGVAIVINSATGIYYGFNELGTAVFEQFRDGASVESVKDALKALAGAPADVEAKLDAFVATLVEKEIFASVDGDGKAATIDVAVAAKDGFAMTCQEFNDAQEMLLADPIHEVKEDTGWTPEKDSIGYTKEETAAREKKVEN